MAEEANRDSSPSLPSVIEEVDNWLSKDVDFLPNLCNVTALLYDALPDVHWLGWYITKAIGGDLTLGPFQGKPTLPRIGWREGVVGSAAFERAVQIVQDVRRFRGHLKDGLETRSEVAVPIVESGLVKAVLCAKAKQPESFGIYEVELLSAAAQRVSKLWEKPGRPSPGSGPIPAESQLGGQ